MPRRGSTSARREEADESIPDPKGRESWTPSLFPCKRAAFRGPRKGVKMPIADPSARRLSAPGAREYPRTSRAARRQPSRLLIPHLAAGPARAARLVCALLRVAWVRPGGRRSLARRNWRALSSGVQNHAELAEGPPRAVRDRLAGADPPRRSVKEEGRRTPGSA
jgi:hypothetical protein